MPPLCERRLFTGLAVSAGADALITAGCLLVGGACEAAVASFDTAAPLWENALLCAGSTASPQLDSGPSPARGPPSTHGEPRLSPLGAFP